jgi:pimeloyl-ACP methyl ester carboxylesterase
MSRPDVRSSKEAVMRSAAPARDPRPIVICLHSSGATGRQWQALAQRLHGDFRVVTPDLCGHGDGPSWHDGDGDILAADARLVLGLARETAARVHLVGHSWGGAVALRALREQRSRFASVAVYEPVLFRLLRDRGEQRAPAALVGAIGRALRADLRAGQRHLGARRFVDFWNGAGSFDALPAIRQDAVAARMPAVAAHFAALWNDAGRLADYATLDVPLRLYVGTQTHVATRTIAEMLAGALPAGSLQRMTAMGHMGPLTHPNIVAQSIAAFVTSNAASRAAVPRAA